MDPSETRWSAWTHAYGRADDIPELLRLLKTFPPRQDSESEPYFTLWSSLCHQGDVYSASYAAVPHLVEIALGSSACERWDPLQLAACIEIARAKGNGPEMPAELAAPYSAALARIRELAQSRDARALDEGSCRVFGAAIAAANGHARLAEAMLELEPALLDDFMEWVSER